MTVVVPVPEDLDGARRCIEWAHRYAGESTEVLVVQPGNPSVSPPWLRALGRVRLVGTAAGDWTHVVADTAGDVVVVVDPLTKVPRRWLECLLAPFADPAVAAVGPRLNVDAGPQSLDQVAGDTASEFQRFAEDRRRRRHGDVTDVDHLAGWCIAVRRDVVVGATGEGGAVAPAAGWSDTGDVVSAWCDTARRDGRRIVVAEGAVAYHGEFGPYGLLGAPIAAADVRISACIIARDEEADIGGCIDSVKDAVDEVVVCDTGSTDQTVAIARARGAEIVEFEWCDDFAAARNAAVEACTGDWVLHIDADERFVCDDPGDLRTRLAAGDVDVLSVPINSFHSDSQTDAVTAENWYERVFRRDLFRYRGRLHERVLPIDPSHRPRADRSRIVSFVHGGYRPSVVAGRDKRGRNLRIAERAYRDGDDEQWYLAYVLGRAHTSMGNHEEAAPYLREALDLMPPRSDGYRLGALIHLASGALQTGDLDAAASAAREALSLDGDNGQARFYWGAVLNRQGRHEAARKVLEQLVEGPLSEAGLSVDHAARNYLGYIELGRAHVGTGELAAAAESFLTAASADPANFPRWAELVRALREADPDGWVERLIAVAEPAPKSLARLARAVEDDGDLEAGLRLWEAVPESTIARLGRGRCHHALGRLDDAIDAVTGIDVEKLPGGELTFLAELAADAGDVPTAVALLDRVDPAGAPEVADRVATIAGRIQERLAHAT